MISTGLDPKTLKMRARDLKHLYKQSRFRKKEVVSNAGTTSLLFLK